MDKKELFDNMSNMLLEGEVYCPFCEDGGEAQASDGDMTDSDSAWIRYECNECGGKWRVWVSRITEIDGLEDGNGKEYDCNAYLSEDGLNNGKLTFKVKG